MVDTSLIAAPGVGRITAPSAPLAERGYPSGAPLSWYGSTIADLDEPNAAMRWPTAGRVLRKMWLDDAQCSAMMLAVTLPIRGTRWFIDPNGARDEVTQHIADDLGLPIHGEDDRPAPRQTGRFSWSEHLERALTSLVYGHAPFEQVYAYGSDALLHLRKLGYRAPSTITAINTARDGGLVSIEQAPYGGDIDPVVIPVSDLVMYVHQMEPGAWRGTSLYRSAYKHWLLKDRALQGWRTTNDRNGQGIMIYEAAPGETDLEPGLKLAQQVRGGESAGASIQNGAKLTPKGVEGLLPQHAPEVAYHDEQIAKAVLAHFLTLGDKSSYALGVTFADFFTMSLQSVGEKIRDVTTRHVIEDLVDLNYGPDEPAPRLAFDEIGTRQAATAADVAQLLSSGVLRPDRSLEESLRQKYGLPPKDTVPPAVPYDPSNPPAPTGGAT